MAIDETIHLAPVIFISHGLPHITYKESASSNFWKTIVPTGRATRSTSRHGDKLIALILRDTWANGAVGSMTALANILTSDRVKVDVARQVRCWSGTLYDDKDYEESLQEIFAFFAPPESVVSPKDKVQESTEFAGSIRFHSATHNAAFSQNQPRFDVRHELKDIKVPALVIAGRYDFIAPVTCSQEIANNISHARLEIFERSGHSPPSDEPEKFEEILTDFLKAEVL